MLRPSAIQVTSFDRNKILHNRDLNFLSFEKITAVQHFGPKSQKRSTNRESLNFHEHGLHNWDLLEISTSILSND